MTNPHTAMSRELLELAERCEKAPVTHQVMLLQEVWDLINGKAEPKAIDHWPGWQMPIAWERFKAMVNAHAYESAAMTLVPEGWHPSHLDWRKATVVAVVEKDMASEAGEAATPALALCAAALRAQDQSSKEMGRG